MKTPNDIARELAHSVPPMDFGSTEAINLIEQALTTYAEERVNEAIERCAELADSESRVLGIQFGCGGTHYGIGTKDCPKEKHHHHDDRCVSIGNKIRQLKAKQKERE